jgi:hypothetical protein
VFWRCFLSQILSGLAVSLGALGITSLAFIIGLIVTLVTGNWPAFAAFAFFLGAIVVAIIISAIIFAFISCLNITLSGSGANPPPPKGSGQGLTGEIDCQTARNLLAAAQNKGKDLENELTALTIKIQAAQGSLQAARTVLTVSLASLAATFFFPWTIPAAVAAIAASIAAVALAVRSLDADLALLQQLSAQLLATQQEIAQDELLVSQECATTEPVSPTSTPGGGIPIPALRRLVSGHV